MSLWPGLSEEAGRGVEQTAGKPGWGGGGEAEYTEKINRRGGSSPAALPPTAPVPQYPLQPPA